MRSEDILDLKEAHGSTCDTLTNAGDARPQLVDGGLHQPQKSGAAEAGNDNLGHLEGRCHGGFCKGPSVRRILVRIPVVRLKVERLKVERLSVKDPQEVKLECNRLNVE